jgi:hypothetical protein
LIGYEGKKVLGKKKSPKRRYIKKTASDLHRTATTAYPCCVPTLGESAGAGRVGLAVANIQTFYIFARQLQL